MRLLGTGLGLAEVIVLGTLLYFLPAIVAYIYRRERLFYIALLNLLTGWSVIGWIGALKWATVRDSHALEEIAPNPRYDTQRKLVIAAAVVGLALAIQCVRVYLLDGPPLVTSKPPPKIDPASVSIRNYAVRGEGGISKGDFTIRNANHFRIKNVVVKCVFATIDATVLGSSEVTVERTFEPNLDQRIRDVDLGPMPKGSANTSCTAQAFVPAD
jgi:hypothetical protein